MENSKISERDDRIKKLEELKNLRINPYPAKADKGSRIAKILSNFEEGKKVKAAGRLRSVRGHGNLTFAHLEDESGRIQIALSKKELGDSYKNFTKLIDTGDFIQTAGECFITHKGEKSIKVNSWKILSKALRPLPDKWHGLKDDDERLRKRYLDILFNPELKEMIEKKAKFWNSAREFMIKKGFLEVETPVLEITAGGADARPFATRHNALDMDVYLRISMGELWQKRLMVAGFEKTFEIGRQFRNEGMDAEHLQDYTQLEFYWAYANYEDGMTLVEEMFKKIAKDAFATHKFKIRGFDIDLNKKWEKYDYTETIEKMTGVNINNADLGEIEAKLKELKVEYDKKGFNITRAIDNLWKYCRKQIAGPGFLVNEPLVVSPLAKKMDNDPNSVERFHVLIAGSELGNGYSELNDPIDQRERFSQQQKLRDEGDDEAQMFDQDFVEALEYGMPPTCGFGMSERVFAFFMDKTMRETQIFPLMRPLLRSTLRQGSKRQKDSDKQAKKASNKKTSPEKSQELGIDYNGALKLLDEYIKDPITKLHMIETEAIMRDLAKHFGEDEDKWGIIGLLHDIDWELTKNNAKEHTIKALDILEKAGASEFLIESIISHGYGHDSIPANKNKRREGMLQHSLAAAETLTGLIIATALMQPDKKLESVKLSSLKKKFRQNKFAANCDRNIISEIENTGLSLDEFLELGLKSLQKISKKLGL